ncbi:ead/Ea22-like family protein [Klebsiella pneumoniae]|nr:ead/Ea22-like family protein [Klebsiella pneumoniae]
MTTDITELAQSLKAAANKAGADDWQAKKISGEFYVIRKGSYSSKCGYRTYQPIAEIDHKSTRDYVAIASPANILALVEALEKAQQVDEELCKLLPPGVEYMDPPDGGDVTPLEGVRRMVADYRQLIAELESRTVKLPDLRQIVSGDRYVWSDGVYNYSQDVKVVLAAAGIKVEAE